MISGPNVGEHVFISRILLSSFQFTLCQFSVWLAFATIVNISQGQSLQQVDLDKFVHVFNQDRLYVALSHAVVPNKIVLFLPSNNVDSKTTTFHIIRIKLVVFAKAM